MSSFTEFEGQERNNKFSFFKKRNKKDTSPTAQEKILLREELSRKYNYYLEKADSAKTDTTARYYLSLAKTVLRLQCEL